MVRAAIDGYRRELVTALGQLDVDAVEAMCDVLAAAQRDRRRVYVAGNGGSAATASHLVCDLSKTTTIHGSNGLRVHSLGDNVPSLTAWSNDRSYEVAFGEQLVTLADPGDVLLVISASGNSENILHALDIADAMGLHRLALLGFGGGAAARMAEIAIVVDSCDYGVVEDTHLAIGHALTRILAQPGVDQLTAADG